MASVARTTHVSRVAASLRRLFEGVPRVDLLLGIAVFATAFVVYNATLAPSLSYRSADGNQLVTVSHQLALAHSPGYPLYTWLGKLFTFLPVGDVAHRVNLMSAAGAAGAAAFAYGIVLLLTRVRLVALFGALFFAFSGTLWSQAVIAEVYAPNAFMVGLTLLLLIAWGRREERRGAPAESDRTSLFLFCGFALSYGLSLGIHLSNLAFAPGIAVFVLLVNRKVLAQRTTMVCAAVLFSVTVLQYVWLPIKAGTLLDPVMRDKEPSTLGGFIDYTVNAFSEERFSYGVQEIPGRIWTYLGLVWDNFGPFGICFLLLGAWAMFRRVRTVFLPLVLVYLVEVGYFVEYNSFDLDVFFIPAHFIGVFFAAYGACWLIPKAEHFASWAGFKSAHGSGLVGVLLILSVVLQLRLNWAANDLSEDTSINDFYEEVLRHVESGSTLVGWRGVFGYDMFYFRQVYDRRPDVAIPFIEDPYFDGPLPEGATTYSVFRPVADAPRRASEPPPELFPDDYSYVPVLAAPVAVRGRLLGPQILPSRPLVLYRLREERPNVFEDVTRPDHPLPRDLGGITFVGFDLSEQRVKRGGSLHLTLYWRLQRPGDYVVTTFMDDGDFREVHRLAFGGLKRYQRQFDLPAGGMIVEDYDLVVLSSTSPGRQVLRVQTFEIDPLSGWIGGWEPVDLAEIEVLD